MTESVLYYCGGTKPILELLVSIYTLKKYYSGDITVHLGKTSEKYIYDLLINNGIIVKLIPGSEHDNNVNKHWSSRWRSMKLLDHDYNLHLDCDMIVNKPIDFLFGMIDKDPETLTAFGAYNNGINDELWPRILKCFQEVIPNFECDPIYLQVGILGINKGWPLADLTSEYCLKTRDDQMAISLALAQNGRKVIHKNQFKSTYNNIMNYWNMSSKAYYQTVLWHGSYGFSIWWREFFRARKDKFMNLHDNKFIQIINSQVYKKLINKNYPNKIQIENYTISNDE